MLALLSLLVLVLVLEQVLVLLQVLLIVPVKVLALQHYHSCSATCHSLALVHPLVLGLPMLEIARTQDLFCPQICIGGGVVLAPLDLGHPRQVP